MPPVLASPSDTPLWGWRWIVRWYVGAGLLALLAWASVGGRRGLGFDGGPAWTGAGHALRGAGCLLSYEDVPRVDPASGLVVLPILRSVGFATEWNDGVTAAARRAATVGPTFGDRIVDPRRIAAAFDLDPGADVGDGSVEFTAGDARVRVDDYDSLGCFTGVPDRLRSGDASVLVDGRVLRVRDPKGRLRNTIARNVARGVVWFPRMASMRARTSDDARTLWLRGADVEGSRWIVTVDLVTGTVLQVDPDPAG